MLFVSVLLLWTQTVAQVFTPIKWGPHISSGDCGQHSDPDLISVLTLLSDILSNDFDNSSLPKSCQEIKESSSDSPAGYYTLLNTTTGLPSITYCDMADPIFCASSLTSVLEKLQVATVKGEKGEAGVPGETGQKGETGPIGFAGQKGDTGSTGEQGVRGPSGSVGTKGEKGGTGSRGPAGPAGPPGPGTNTASGAVYTRWGSSSCPNVTGTERVREGRAGKVDHDQGGGTNYQCMPNEPDYSSFSPDIQGYSRMYGVEYKSPVRYEAWNGNAPCAVCFVSTREAVMMIPARLTCPASWTLEYTGFLMTQQQQDGDATFECVDASQEIVENSLADSGGGTFYQVEATCNRGLSCPGYNQETEVTCVVCTR